MPILRKIKKEHYTTISNDVFMDRELSLKAKGILCQMLSLPDNWSFSIEGLKVLCADGKTSVMNALNELEEAGYLHRERVVVGGKFAGIDYIVSEYRMSDFPNAENPNTEKPNAENPPQLNTKESNTNNKYKEKAKPKVKTDLHREPSLRPTLDEINEYIREKGLRVNAETFYNYFDASEWVDSLGKPVKNWKQKLITWSNNNENRGSNGKRTGLRGTTRKGNGSVGNGEVPEWFKLPPSAPTLSEDE